MIEAILTQRHFFRKIDGHWCKNAGLGCTMVIELDDTLANGFRWWIEPNDQDRVPAFVATGCVTEAHEISHVALVCAALANLNAER